jgi:hypothetical protein
LELVGKLEDIPVVDLVEGMVRALVGALEAVVLGRWVDE